MKQLTQSLKDGTMNILEVPFPALEKGMVLVKNHYSAISTGTEGKTVSDARLGYIGKAKARKEEVKKVIDSAKKVGIVKTYDMVMNKLESPSALGYSCAGEVIEIGPGVRSVKVGDLVACGGKNAVHAEVVAIHENLMVKIDPKSSLKHACYTTIGSIAMQGIRQADLRIGENCVVIGLGMIGQLTIQILKASGVKVIGIDIDQKMVDLSVKSGADIAVNRNADEIHSLIESATDGYGTDAVIITAGTSSLDPIDFAGSVARKKGKVIIVGAVPTGFNRKNYYRKEIEIKMSCSYGPGRYDVNYEEHGLDYPISYVRWTENRNMSAFAQLLKSGSVQLDHLITHEFPFEKAKNAYDIVVNKAEPFVGIVLGYNTEQKHIREKTNRAEYSPKEVNIGFIGAGSFAQNFLLPSVKGNLVTVATAHPNTAKNIATKYGFENFTCKSEEITENDAINTVFIATRHNLHAANVIASLHQGKNVFVEKPLCMTEGELSEIKSVANKFPKTRVMVGFNRRFSPAIDKLKNHLNQELPKAINYRINAGKVPSDHWVHDPSIGGGRIIGEVCHFIDLAMFIADSPIESVSALALDESIETQDSVVITLSFRNGSVASINYFSNGSKKLPKEYIEVFSGGKAMVIDDFQTLNIYADKQSKIKFSGQDKGHRKGVEAFISSIKNGTPSPIAFNEVYLSTQVTFRVIESIQNNGRRIFFS